MKTHPHSRRRPPHFHLKRLLHHPLRLLRHSHLLLAKILAGKRRATTVKDETFEDAVKYLNSVEGKPGVDYEWALEYAKLLWEDWNNTFNVLDEKAESIIKYLGGGTGLFALGVLSKIDSHNAHIAAWSFPTVIVALLSVFLAMWTRKPFQFPELPSIRNAKEAYADAIETKEAAVGAFLGQWNLACEKAKWICDRKAALLNWSTWLYFAAISLLLLPLLAAVICPPIAK
jgi:hypothetical protein